MLATAEPRSDFGAFGFLAVTPIDSSPSPAPWHFFYFFPLPHGQGSFRPTLGSWPMKSDYSLRSQAILGEPEDLLSVVKAPIFPK